MERCLKGALPRSFSGLASALCLIAACAGGCKANSTRPIVSAIDLSENSEPPVVDDGAVLDGLATYDDYDPNVFSRDLERVERYYRARGYYEAKVTAARVLVEDKRHVRIEIRVAAGEAVLVDTVNSPGLANLPFGVVSEIATARHLMEPGTLFDEGRFDEMKAAILDALQDRGFPFAKVEAKAHVDLAKHRAVVVISIEPGSQATFGEVTIVGLREIPEGPVRDILDIRPGRRYSRARLSEAQRAVLNLGVFSSVEVHEDLTHPESQRVPIELVVRESELKAVRLGAGADFDVLRLNFHLKVGWEHLNFLGGTRDFAVSDTPGVDLYPTRLGEASTLAPTRALLENSLQLKFRQPSFVEARTTGTVDARYDIKPLLYPLNGVDPDTQPVIGFHTVAASLGVQREFTIRLARRTRGHLTIAPSYNWQNNSPFAYQGDLPPGLRRARACEPSCDGPNPDVSEVGGPVFVAFPALVTTLDFRDDPVSTHRGVYLTNSLQVADRIFGGRVSDVRIQPEVRGYVPITPRSVTLATRLTLGFLFPRDYGDTLNLRSSQGQLSTTDPTAARVVFDQEKLLLRAFYSGGSTSNRGYPLRGVGPHGPVGFLLPPNTDCRLDATQPACIRPLGGFTLWEASVELRFPLAGALSMVTFADASDVTRDVGHIRFNVPHLSVGPGIRYLTPVGPLRLDVGYRVPGAQFIGHDSLPPEEGSENGIFGISWLPFALNVAIGESF